MASLHREQHHRRLRFRSRSVSWIFAPLLVVAVGCWLLFNAVVCSGGHASTVELLMCAHAHALPDVFILLTAVSVVSLFLGLADLGEGLSDEGEDLGGEEAPRGRRRRRWRSARHAYRNLNDPHQSIVWFAFEMSVWAGAAALGALLFYLLEWAFPMGFLTIAALLTILLRLGRRTVRRFGGGGRQAPPPTAPAPRSGEETSTAQMSA